MLRSIEICAVSKKVGDRIRKYRELADLSQENVAEEIGMSGGNYGKIERGEIDINTEYLHKLAKILKVHVSNFFDDKPILAFNEKNNPYGFVGQTEFDNLVEAVSKLANEVTKIKELLQSKKGPTKLKGKK